jgi:hypothetical protein
VTSGHGSDGATRAPSSAPSTASRTSGNGTPSAAAPSATPSTSTQLASFMKSGVTSLHSAHLSLIESLAGHKITGEGDEQLAGGTATAFRITERVPGTGRIELVMVHNNSYAKLPKSLNQSNKPWLLVAPGSTNPVVAQLSSSLSQLRSSTSLDKFAEFAKLAKKIKVDGPATIQGNPATHYSIRVDTSKLPVSAEAKKQIKKSGIRTIPIELWVDDTGRPVKMTEKIAVGGQHVDVTVVLSKFNAPVSIKAPPASQVSGH